jgi:hypothetical protein
MAVLAPLMVGTGISFGPNSEFDYFTHIDMFIFIPVHVTL